MKMTPKKVRVLEAVREFNQCNERQARNADVNKALQDGPQRRNAHRELLELWQQGFLTRTLVYEITNRGKKAISVGGAVDGP